MNRTSTRRDTEGKVVVAGSILVDFLVGPVDGLPHWGENAFVSTPQMCLGGLAANAARCLAKLGSSVDIIGSTGDDLFGRFAREQLEESGVNCRHLRSVPKEATGLSFGFIGESGERLFVVSLGANASLSRTDLRRLNWKAVHGFHLGGFFHLPGLESVLPALFRSFERRGIFTSLDLAWDPSGSWNRAIGPSLHSVDYFFPNEAQARRLTNEPTPLLAARKLHRQGVRTVVVKLGAKGCYVHSESWQGLVPGVPVRTIDTTGAGDNFDAAFLHGVVQGWRFEACARFANVVAAASTRSIGAILGVPSWETALRWVRHFYGKKWNN